MPCYYDTIPTPLGPFTAAANETGALLATAFGDAAALLTRFAGKNKIPTHLTHSPANLAPLRQQLREYFTGTRRVFNLSLSPTNGTPHQRRVWTALTEIPYGETRSYADLAKKLLTSPRAVGRANATNPMALIVPCHRVIGADGALTGYAFGEEIKRHLLAHEAAHK